jgi:hypothetical protein
MCNSMHKGPSLEVTSRSATQESPNIIWNLKVHYIIHKSVYTEPDQSSPYHPILFI